jgi:dCMP deaminase
VCDRWDSYYLQLALDTARMSKDPNVKVGVVIVGHDREVISSGFNGFPRGIKDSFNRLSNRETKLRIIVHGEMNATLNALRAGLSIKGCTLYTALTDSTGLVYGCNPCTRCSVHLIQAGLAHIVSYKPKSGFSNWQDDNNFAKALLDEAGVTYRDVAYLA